LLDQYGPLEFTLRDPATFMKIARRHRMLFARDCPNIPYSVPAGLSIERLTHPTRQIVNETAALLSRWRAGNHEEKTATFPASAEVDMVLADSAELTSLVVAMDQA
jgi:hypothetical protein